MHKEHNAAALVQNSCDMCFFNSHLSCVLNNHIDRKKLGILKTFECNKCKFSEKSKGVLQYHEHPKHTKKHPNM